MAKRKIQFACTNCGALYSAWSGRCTQCGEWNSITEELEAPSYGGAKSLSGKALDLKPVTQAFTQKNSDRLIVAVGDIDELLGGGIVPGSVLLIAGQPGIGKSTLLMQIAMELASRLEVVYISGEESIDQVAMRAIRLGKHPESLKLASSSSTEDVIATIVDRKPKLLIVDSIQTMTCADVNSAAGSVSQITNSTLRLAQAAKAVNTALIIVGHVTKEGSIAGPKLLEHMVDVVLNLEGDRYGGFKVLRAIKNRYGSTNEASIFEMRDNGLAPVDNPSAALLEERQVSDGSIVLATLEGTRPLLVEVQALVNTTAFGYPKRAASGFDLNRLNLLVAVLEKRTKLQLSDKDIFINIVGGIKLQDPAADLAICMAIASATKAMKLSKDAVVFGEIGLSGEVRHVAHIDKRINEAKKLGFKLVIGPRSRDTKTTIHHEVKEVREALNKFLSK